MNAIEQLEPLLKRYRSEPFEWGVNDCVLFTARCIDAQLGGYSYLNLVSELYRYMTFRQAYRMMINLGGLEAATSHHLGEPTNWARLENGDVVLGRAMDRDVQLLGVLYNQGFLTTGPLGIVTMSMDYALKGWKLCR